MSDALESTGAPVASSTDDAVGKCPVDLETRSLWGLWGKKIKPNDEANSSSSSQQQHQQQAPSLEEAARHAQTPHSDQRLPLSTHRLESTIPRTSTSTIPGHQIRAQSNDSNNTWVYPSEQQVFNAMKRKGWKGIEEESIPSFLQIHNSVNERSWREVQKWEEGCGIPADEVELSRFEGRPKDLTPKAWLMSTLGLCDKPFDRHDWYVVRKPSNNNARTSVADVEKILPEQRYVLDFYMTGDDNNQGGMPRVEIDVRPALDSPRALFQRGQGLLKEVFPGIARELNEMQKR